MRHQIRNSIILFAAALSLGAMVPFAVSAQDHPEDHHDDSRSARDDHRDDNRSDHHDTRNDHHDDNRGDPAAQYRHDHPHASARCHDGFFTTTKDRGRACTKHGGIDVWIAL